jgi:hypothetical protein
MPPSRGVEKSMGVLWVVWSLPDGPKKSKKSDRGVRKGRQTEFDGSPGVTLSGPRVPIQQERRIVFAARQHHRRRDPATRMGRRPGENFEISKSLLFPMSKGTIARIVCWGGVCVCGNRVKIKVHLATWKFQLAPHIYIYIYIQCRNERSRFGW